ncbi:hypothetical protein FE697_006715 [Mumia zhuanghuii]|uniref:Uncharacterized protein n=2 Tax=Mumia TaxID=1546255 RepID=A0ABW1QKF1_9ACTN|nr:MULTISPECIES: hypothetical protein [Mumia]KAA1423308.1 hypothetical protein FE697_006715 [Mumia zhuanghuii]
MSVNWSLVADVLAAIAAVLSPIATAAVGIAAIKAQRRTFQAERSDSRKANQDAITREDSIRSQERGRAQEQQLQSELRIRYEDILRDFDRIDGTGNFWETAPPSQEDLRSIRRKIEVLPPGEIHDRLGRVVELLALHSLLPVLSSHPALYVNGALGTGRAIVAAALRNEAPAPETPFFTSLLAYAQEGEIQSHGDSGTPDFELPSSAPELEREGMFEFINYGRWTKPYNSLG